jgi:DNA gyrase subunit A
MVDVPASTGYGEPIMKFFRLADQVKVIGVATTDPRFTPEDQPTKRDVPGGPYVLVVTAQGQVLRTPLGAFRTASTKVGRRYVRLVEDDRVVMATVLTGEESSLFLASRDGHVLHFAMKEVSILAGAGKGVIGIKLDDGDVCIGGAIVARASDRLVVEASDGKPMEFTGRHEVVGRGGKGFEAVKRKTFARVVPPPIVLADWDAFDAKEKESGGKKDEGQKTLFE